MHIVSISILQFSGSMLSFLGCSWVELRIVGNRCVSLNVVGDRLGLLIAAVICVLSLGIAWGHMRSLWFVNVAVSLGVGGGRSVCVCVFVVCCWVWIAGCRCVSFLKCVCVMLAGAIGVVRFAWDRGGLLMSLCVAVCRWWSEGLL